MAFNRSDRLPGSLISNGVGRPKDVGGPYPQDDRAVTVGDADLFAWPDPRSRSQKAGFAIRFDRIIREADVPDAIDSLINIMLPLRR